MAKRYITSDTPRLAQSSARPTQYITGKRGLRKPVKTWKTVLKEHKKSRTVKVQERAKPIPAELAKWLESIAE